MSGSRAETWLEKILYRLKRSGSREEEVQQWVKRAEEELVLGLPQMQKSTFPFLKVLQCIRRP